ncbi:site-specific integrase [Pseudarthrobacter sp. NCCP-2145]|uniref:site-specific integrase n=1 Tax=Pseudarthrobacter sp. NCCP-2145 TaxID=2942290 RepID=UPI00203D00CE|nr:site-specific integrase [Pseudarthrobacter sp. NCCP-2145]
MSESVTRTWHLHFVQALPQKAADALLVRALGPLSDGHGNAARVGRPFLLDGRGSPHAAVNAFFSSRRMRNRAASTNRKYAFALRVWMNFLELRQTAWDAAADDDLFDYKFWRRTDENNPRRVAGSTWRDDLSAISAFYGWAEGFQETALASLGTPDSLVRGPRDRRTWGTRPEYSAKRGRAGASTVRSADVKWFSPGAFRRWRDVGILGMAPDGTERIRWRPRSLTRDAAFVDGLHGTGLRLQEWASVLVNELRHPSDENNYVTLRLADACAKGGHGRPYWAKREVLNSVWNYIETERASSIRRARASGVYERLSGMRIICEVREDALLTLSEPGRPSSLLVLNDLSPEERQSLFVRTAEGLEPLALWLNEDGLPRGKRSWYKCFNGANRRVARAGIDRLQCHPHVLRHSFALRWYAVGRLVWERRAPSLSPGQALDFREQFGDTWSLVQMMLGHSDVNTTRDIYLDPFRGLDVKLLLEHGVNELQAETLLHVLRPDPRVRLDEVRPVEESR